MIKTDQLEPKAEEEPKKLQVITTNKLEPKAYDPPPQEYPGIIKKETRSLDIKGVALQTATMERVTRNERRRQLMEKRRILMAQKRADEAKAATLAENIRQEKIRQAAEKKAEKKTDGTGTGKKKSTKTEK